MGKKLAAPRPPLDHRWTVAKSETKSKRTLLWTSTTYFGEGLPWSFLHQLATEFLTAIGSSKSVISSTSGFHLAVTFKFLWSPLVDLFGRKRTWLWVMQLLVGLGMLAIAGIAVTVAHWVGVVMDNIGVPRYFQRPIGRPKKMTWREACDTLGILAALAFGLVVVVSAAIR